MIVPVVRVPLIRVVIPTLAVKLPKPTTAVIRDDLCVTPAGGAVRVDIYGEVHGNRVVAMLTPEQARQLATELARAAKNLS